MKNIYIVLTRTNTILSKFISFLKNDEYTHASISLEKSLNTMFSFGRKNVYNPLIGSFVKENLCEGVYGLHNNLHGLVIEINVTDEQYNKAEKLLNEFTCNSKSFKYNYIGLMYSLLNKEFYNDKKFLCSEFVYYILYTSKIADLKIPRNLVRPQNLLYLKGRVVYKGNLKNINRPLGYLKYNEALPTY